MTRMIFSIAFLLQCLFATGQNSQTIEKYNLDQNCYDESGQQEINICYLKAAEKLSEILQTKYDCIMAFLDNRIMDYSNKDTIMVTYYSKMKQNIISSQEIWDKLKKENALFYDGGGTITPMLIGQSLIRDIKDRLSRLDDYIEYIGQGNDDKILKCE